MDEFWFVDTENRGAGAGGGAVGFHANSSIASNKETKVARERRSSNNKQPQPLTGTGLNSLVIKDYIEKLEKENIVLQQLLQGSRHELTKLRTIIWKLEKQNCQLAQANTQMTTDHTLCRDKMRVMQHELGCKRALLAAKDMAFVKEQVVAKEKTQTKTVEATVADGGGDTANEEPKRSHPSRILASVKEQVVAKEKPQNKRKDEVFSGCSCSRNSECKTVTCGCRKNNLYCGPACSCKVKCKRKPPA